MKDVEKAANLSGMLAKVAQFNSMVVGFPIPSKPSLLSEDRQAFRDAFLEEERREGNEAYARGDLEEVVDAHIDSIYVHLGALVEMGITPGPCFDAVHAANMAKKRGEQSKRGHGNGFDAVKPEGWQPPSHADYLSVTRSDIQTILDLRALGPVGQVAVQQTIAAGADLVRSAKNPFAEKDRVYYVGPEAALQGAHGEVMEVDELGAIIVRFDDKGLPIVGVSPRELVPEELADALPVYKPKIIVMGYARHGKDTVADLLRDKYGLKFTSSSEFCAERIVFPYFQSQYTIGNLAERDPGLPVYNTAQECFEDRGNHRSTWYDLITEFNTPDLTALGKAIFEEHQVYAGIRNAREYHALRNAGAFDFAIWVDAFERVGSKEDSSSCTVEPWMADFVLDNNGGLADLERNLDQLMTALGYGKAE